MSDALASALDLTVEEVLAPTPAGPDLDKWVVFVPVEDADAVRQAMFDAGAGQMGDYSHCSWSATGTGQFLPHDGANPAIGSVGTVERVSEDRIEVIAPARRRARVLAALRSAHPYEEPAFDIFTLAPVPGNVGLGRIGVLPSPEPLSAFVSRVCDALPATSWGVRGSGEPDSQVSRVAVCGERATRCWTSSPAPTSRPTSPPIFGTTPSTSTGALLTWRSSTWRTGPVSTRGVIRPQNCCGTNSATRSQCECRRSEPIRGMLREQVMKAEVAQQRSLLELAELDAGLNRIEHRAKNLAEQQHLEEVQGTLQEANDKLAALQLAIDGFDDEVAKFETEIDGVRQREDRDRRLLADGSVDAKQLTELQHELQTLERRQAALEDALLEVMERREELQRDQGAALARIDELQSALGDAQKACDDARAEIDQQRHQSVSRRDELISGLAPDLAALYERQRERGGAGAGLLQGRRCGACRIEIDKGELARISAAADDDLLRCPECGAILLRLNGTSA